MRITIRGLDRFNRRMDNLADGIQPALFQATKKAVLLVHSRVPPYPEPPANSTYRRTGTLGRSITTDVREVGRDVVGTIGTAIVYAPWVISSEQVGNRGPQAGAHRGRWYTLQGVVQKSRDDIIKVYIQAIKKLVGD